MPLNQVHLTLCMGEDQLAKVCFDTRMVAMYIQMTKPGQTNLNPSPEAEEERFKKGALAPGTRITLTSGAFFPVMESYDEVTRLLEEAERSY